FDLVEAPLALRTAPIESNQVGSEARRYRRADVADFLEGERGRREWRVHLLGTEPADVPAATLGLRIVGEFPRQRGEVAAGGELRLRLLCQRHRRVLAARLG